VADTIFGTDGLAAPMAAAAAIPFLASPENVSASALLLRGRYDLRGWLLSVTMGIRLIAILVGASIGVTAALGALAVGQLLATAIAGTAGSIALHRFPRADARALGGDRREIVSFVAHSSVATGVVSLRSALTPVLLGLVAGTTQVGYYRVALAPQSGFSAASAPVRLVLLTEQTRDWEYGREQTVLRGLRRYSLGAAVVAAVAVPVFLLAMPWLVRVVFGSEYLPAVDAARIVLVAAAIQLVLGWSKSLPVTIGRPHLRVVTHGIEALVLLPLVVVLGDRWGVTGAAVAILIATLSFAGAWAVVLVRLRDELRAARRVGAPRAVGS
ncbi:MAG TPA: oligosaccharide flippase family protein, partial [Gaiella sp.]|nr:oligosaccharide flippase family protein [Gaiella sp.]